MALVWGMLHGLGWLYHCSNPFSSCKRLILVFQAPLSKPCGRLIYHLWYKRIQRDETDSTQTIQEQIPFGGGSLDDASGNFRGLWPIGRCLEALDTYFDSNACFWSLWGLGSSFFSWLCRKVKKWLLSCPIGYLMLKSIMALLRRLLEKKPQITR